MDQLDFRKLRSFTSE